MLLNKKLGDHPECRLVAAPAGRDGLVSLALNAEDRFGTIAGVARVTMTMVEADELVRRLQFAIAGAEAIVDVETEKKNLL